MIWFKKEINAAKTRELAALYDIDLILASILTRRNITDPEALMFFLEDDIRFLHNPFLFKEMVKAVERVRRAVEGKERVLIYGDRDVDGITSTVLLHEAFSARGLAVQWKVPVGDEDYGLSTADVDDAFSSGVSLLVTVDCGISNLKEIEYAKVKGIDVIVLDHHLPQNTLPAASAVINPKIPDSGYPFRDLSGCGVASKFDWALAFSESGYYNTTVVLLHCTPLHESYTIEAAAFTNLVEERRFRENVVPPLGNDILKKLSGFIGRGRIYLFEREEQCRLLEKAFGSIPEEWDIHDFQPQLKETFPLLSEKSLLKIRELSRIGRYMRQALSETEMFKNLFISAVLKAEKNLFTETVKRFDLAALGTIADLMPFVNENRIIVKKGLEIISAFQRDGLRELFVRKNLLGKEISVKDIAWQISPVINASGRLGEPDKAVELFLARDREKLDELSRYICTLNEKRKELGNSIWKKMLSLADESLQKTEGKFVLVTGPEIHRGITGVLATKMVNYFKTPVCVVAELEKKAVGSVRSVKEFPLTSFLYNFDDLFSDYGGHDMAAGFNLPLEQLELFKTRFYDVARTLAPPEEKEESLFVDAEIPASYLTPGLYQTVKRLLPYGEANPALLFYTRGLVIDNCEVVGKKEQGHLKMLLNTGTYKFPAMLWNGVEEYGQRFKIADKVDVVYRMHKNFFMNTETIQLVIRDIAVSGEQKLATLHTDEPFFDSSRRSDF